MRKLNSNELFDIIHKLDCHVYYLYEYPKNIPIFPEWDNETNDYKIIDATTDVDFRTNYFIEPYFAKDDPLLQYIYPASKDFIIAPPYLEDELTTLSDTPLLLSQLIQQDKHLEYDENTKKLTIQPDINTLNSLNALLKNPIRILTIEQIYQLEQKINRDHIQGAEHE